MHFFTGRLKTRGVLFSGSYSDPLGSSTDPSMDMRWALPAAAHEAASLSPEPSTEGRVGRSNCFSQLGNGRTRHGRAADHLRSGAQPSTSSTIDHAQPVPRTNARTLLDAIAQPLQRYCSCSCSFSNSSRGRLSIGFASFFPN